MEKIFEFFQTIPNSLIASLALTVSIFAAIVSVINSSRLRKKIYCSVSEQAIPVSHLYAINKDLTQDHNPFGMRYSHVITVSIINPSAAPISYFDLEVTDDKRFFLYPVQRLIDAKSYAMVCWTSPRLPGNNLRLLPPVESHGIIHPNSYLLMELAVNTANVKEVRVSFKISKRTLFKNRFHSNPERFKTYSRVVSVPREDKRR